MSRQHIFSALIVASYAAMVASCGGTSLSGNNNIIKKKERTAASEEDGDAKDPQVVTGAYLTCERSSKDATGSGNDAVGCSVMSANDKPINPSSNNKLSLKKSLNGGSYLDPTQKNTASGHQALFINPKSETNSTKYIATYANNVGINEIVCDGNQLPCKKPLTFDALPMYVSLNSAAVWNVDQGISGMTEAWDKLNTKNFCSNGAPRIGKSPAKKDLNSKIPGMGFIADAIGNFTTLQQTDIFSVDTRDFCVLKRSNDGFATTGDGCHVTLMKKQRSDFNIDHTSTSSARIKDDLFALVMKQDQVEDSQLESLLSKFSCK